MKKEDLISKRLNILLEILNIKGYKVYAEDTKDNKIYIFPHRTEPFDFSKHHNIKSLFEDLISHFNGTFEDNWPDKYLFNIRMDSNITLKEINKIFDKYENLINSKNSIKKFKL